MQFESADKRKSSFNTWQINNQNSKAPQYEPFLHLATRCKISYNFRSQIRGLASIGAVGAAAPTEFEEGSF